MELKAEVTPWSSIVGAGLVLVDETGKCVAMLAIHGVQAPEGELREMSMAIAQSVAKAINAS